MRQRRPAPPTRGCTQPSPGAEKPVCTRGGGRPCAICGVRGRPNGGRRAALLSRKPRLCVARCAAAPAHSGTACGGGNASAVVVKKEIPQPHHVTCGGAVAAPLLSPSHAARAHGALKPAAAAAAPCVAALRRQTRPWPSQQACNASAPSCSLRRPPPILRSCAARASSLAPRGAALRRATSVVAPLVVVAPHQKPARGVDGAQVPPRPPRAAPAQPHDVPAAQLVAPPLPLPSCRPSHPHTPDHHPPSHRPAPSPLPASRAAAARSNEAPAAPHVA